MVDFAIRIIPPSQRAFNYITFIIFVRVVYVFFPALIGVSLLPIIIVVVIADGELTSGTQHKVSNINNKQYN
ncbi:hypothetical protein V1477_004551 [Vespula maculifrons]|uniref:Uncharacterized protein n=1 Tax=Vespula maculifrons TaxID=7453 RepID=A0ABD2CM79_VESMC